MTLRQVYLPGGAGSANVAWGPDFGESSDNNTFTVGASVAMPELAVEGNLGAGVNLVLEKAGANYNTQTVGAHLSGTALGAPFWQSVTTATSAAPGSDFRIAVPAGTQSGDLLIVFHCHANLGDDVGTTTEAGWTRIDSHRTVGAGFVLNGELWYRIAGSSEPADYGFNGNNGTSILEMHRIIAVAGTPINTSAGATLLATALDPDPDSPSVTTTVVNCLVMSFLFHDHLALSQTHTPAASHSERTDVSIGTTAIVGSNTQDRVFGSAASTGTVVHNCTETTSSNAIMFRVAIAPGTLTLAS